MSHVSSIKRLATLAAATALTAVGVVAVPAPANAAPACETWGWPAGTFVVKAGNGTTTFMPTSGNNVVGRPYVKTDNAVDQADWTSYGNPSGGFTGTNINITINWDQGRAAGTSSNFVGTINADGLASGVVHNSNRDDSWNSDNKFNCVTLKKEAPKQGPTVSWNPTIGGLIAHITDRSGVTSQCTYTSDFYTRSFRLDANTTFDLKIVPAVPMLRNWDVNISCDNGTSTQTTTFF